MQICVDDFALNLREAIFKKRLSQKKLADRINTEQPMINGYCTGRTQPSLWMFCLICEALDVTPNELLKARDK